MGPCCGVLAGLLTDGEGEPLSIQLYRGNPNDPPMFPDVVEKLKVCFGVEEVALVGDRGMTKASGQQALGEAEFRYGTALTEPQVPAQGLTAADVARGPWVQTGTLELDETERVEPPWHHR
jgi:hypothetical protein